MSALERFKSAAAAAKASDTARHARRGSDGDGGGGIGAPISENLLELLNMCGVWPDTLDRAFEGKDTVDVSINAFIEKAKSDRIEDENYLADNMPSRKLYSGEEELALMAAVGAARIASHRIASRRFEPDRCGTRHNIGH